MKKLAPKIIITLMIIAGLSLLLYPTVSDYFRNLSYRRVISSYEETVEAIDDDTYEAMLAEARAYNDRLRRKGGFDPTFTEAEQAEYDAVLDVTGTGVMGYVTIPKVNIVLPIYHGTSDGVLQMGTGHLEGTFLPVGGESTHTALTAHTGLPSSKLFTDIDQLEVGDTFAVRVLREVLTYEVDQILVVLPHETDSLWYTEGEDYCTLVTCTPYGVNTHRLLVRGHRVPTPPDDEPPDTHTVLVPLGSGVGNLDPGQIVLLLLLAALLVLAAVIIVRRHRAAQNKKKPGRHLARPEGRETQKDENERPKGA